MILSKNKVKIPGITSGVPFPGLQYPPTIFPWLAYLNVLIFSRGNRRKKQLDNPEKRPTGQPN